MVNAQEYINQNYPKEKRNQIIELNLERKDLEGSLDLSDFTNLKKLNLRDNQLTNLDFLRDLNPQEFEALDLIGNYLPNNKNLEIFAPFTKLKALAIGGVSSKFTGSLKPLRNMNELEWIMIVGTDITHGLEYLPDSVEKFFCLPLGSENKINDIHEELQPFGGDIKKWREVKMEKKPHLTLASLIPSQLINEFKKESGFITKSKLIESNLNREVNYDKLHFNLWNKSNQALIPKESPTKLYNVRENKIEKTAETNNMQPYAILSYVWGKSHNRDIKKGDAMITSSANKSISKAIKALEVINKEQKHQPIGYLWVDQLCMNQEDQHEKSLEVPKMGKYYDNASLTLINMNAEIGNLSNIDLTDALRKIVNSKWFSRSWTYQEGWLSKHTIFMFDDKLIDGRAMAGTWALNQLSYVDGGKYNSRSEFDRGTKKIATPVGWVYYREGYDTTRDKVELTLTQALYAIKNRKRTVALDGIYSILGLLPYGKDINVKYRVKKCQHSEEEWKNKEICQCPWEDNNPQDALKEVMKLAVEKGYAEPFAWHGISNKSWMPQIDENGSTSVMGSVGKLSSKEPFNNENMMVFTEEGIMIGNEYKRFPCYTILPNKNQNTHKLESGFEIEGGLYKKDVTIKLEGSPREPINVSLLGTRETLDSVKENCSLTVLYKEVFQTNKLFALLLEKTEKEGVYHRLGLVELGNSEQIKLDFEELDKYGKKTIIGESSSQIDSRSNQRLELQTQIQVEPK